MTIAEKLVTVAENQQKVYDAGKQTERDDFWETFQKGGELTPYYYAFAYDKYSDDTYNPKYSINCSDGATGAGAAFYNNYKITDTKVPIIVRKSCSQMFGNCSYLRRIASIEVSETATFPNAFNYCNSLTDITMTGTLASSVNLSWSPLSVESMKSIISCLKNFTGTGNEQTCTLTFSDACWASLEADSTSPVGGAWKDYVISLGWAV